MKEYVKKFEDASAADNYSIAYIPFTTSVATNPIQNLVCNESGKILVNESGTLTVRSTPSEMVDLGLSVKWAATNIGANPGSTPESYYGDFYAWGEIETKSNYSWNTYTKHTNGTYSSSNKKVFIKYVPTNKTEYWNGEGTPDNKFVLDAVDDIATQTYGSNYRMPTIAELNKLIALPNQWVTDYNGVSGLNGRVFTGTNGNTLFIPAAGNFRGSTHNGAGRGCSLRSSSLDSYNPYCAWDLGFNSDLIEYFYEDRYIGFSVRAVKSI